MKEGTKQIQKPATTDPIPESYLLCKDCDGTWVDSRHGDCGHCDGNTTSKDFHLCLACALRTHSCQHCGQQVQVHITQC